MTPSEARKEYERRVRERDRAAWMSLGWLGLCVAGLTCCAWWWFEPRSAARAGIVLFQGASAGAMFFGFMIWMESRKALREQERVIRHWRAVVKRLEDT